MTLQNAFGDLALDATLAATNTKLDSILTELGTKLDGGGTVALDSASLAALESISASVSNWPGDFPDSAVLAKLETIRLLLAAGITVTGPLTDTQLRATPVVTSIQGSDGSNPHTIHTDSDGSVIVAGTASAGSPAGDNPIPVAGVDASNHVQYLKVAADGSLYITQSGISDGTQKTQVVGPGGTSATVNADGSLAVTEQTAQDLMHLLGQIASRLGMNDGVGKMLVNIVGQAVAQSGTWTVQPGNTANTTAWLMALAATSTTLYGPQGFMLDQHYQSIQAFDVLRAKITVS